MPKWINCLLNVKVLHSGFHLSMLYYWIIAIDALIIVCVTLMLKLVIGGAYFICPPAPNQVVSWSLILHYSWCSWLYFVLWTKKKKCANEVGGEWKSCRLVLHSTVFEWLYFVLSTTGFPLWSVVFSAFKKKKITANSEVSPDVVHPGTK